LLQILKIRNNLPLIETKAQITINYNDYLMVMPVGAVDMAMRYFFLCGLANL
jgi:hypothetical protein